MIDEKFCFDPNNPNIEDCNDHSFTITWDPRVNKLELFYNDAVSGSTGSWIT